MEKRKPHDFTSYPPAFRMQGTESKRSMKSMRRGKTKKKNKMKKKMKRRKMINDVDEDSNDVADGDQH